MDILGEELAKSGRLAFLHGAASSHLALEDFSDAASAARKAAFLSALSCIHLKCILQMVVRSYDLQSGGQPACFSSTFSADFSASRTCFRQAFQAASASRRATASTISCISLKVSGRRPGLDIEVERYWPT